MDIWNWIIILKTLLCLSTLVRSSNYPPFDSCLTGYMTDVQQWIDVYGALTDYVDRATVIDLSATPNPAAVLQNQSRERTGDQVIRYMSMARCGLMRVPKVFNTTVVGRHGLSLASTLEYLTFYGNKFVEVSEPGEEYDVIFNATNVKEAPRSSMRSSNFIMWFNGFQEVHFERLKELDLRACDIKTLMPFQFKYMPYLEALYLGENAIHTIQANAFGGLQNLLHLDLSRNIPVDAHGNLNLMLMESSEVFQVLNNLTSLDLSHTKMNQRNIAAFRVLGKSLERLSVCHIGPLKLGDRFFKTTSLKILDVSGNYDMLSDHLVLAGLESTLEVLYANDIGLSNFDIFENFSKLEVLMLSRNEITNVRPYTVSTLTNLQILNLSNNRISRWLSTVYANMTSLKLLDLSNNNINVISEQMMMDLKNVRYLGFAQNSPMVCNCRCRDLIKIASKNEMLYKAIKIQSNGYDEVNTRFGYHRSFIDVNSRIFLRSNISSICKLGECGDSEYNMKLLLLDYSVATYSCFEMVKGSSVHFTQVLSCEEEKSMKIFENISESGWNSLILLWIIPGILVPVMFVAFTFRRSIKYFYVTMRNSAMIGIVNQGIPPDDDTIFNYDVFVSYCHEDRPWVLDKLLNQLEKGCSVSLCLHERDFQVGFTILENIVSCMDRSKFILLVISKQFLVSQWCQFEMHLAQHRLLETRREDLILVLLEEIPRSIRPNTLHYLMLTKTYIVWPQEKKQQQLFWKRLKKTVVSHKLRHQRNESVA